MYKIYKKNNYVIIDDDISTPEWYLAKDILVQEVVENVSYEIFGILPRLGNFINQLLCSVSIPDILKENGLPYTESEWLDFYTLNTGATISTSSNISQSTIYSLDRSTVTETLTTGGISQTIVSINSERKGFEFQNQSSDNLILGIGVNPSINNGFIIPAGGTYNTTNTVSTREIKVWGATAGQRFTYIEY